MLSWDPQLHRNTPWTFQYFWNQQTSQGCGPLMCLRVSPKSPLKGSRPRQGCCFKELKDSHIPQFEVIELVLNANVEMNLLQIVDRG